MLIALLIMLREGIEAALIVGIVASFLKQSGHSELMPKVWLGVFLAAAMCLGIGYGIHSVTGEIPQKEQELVVGVIGLVAVAMLTYMILWMKKAARSMKRQLQDSVQAALNRGSGQGWALVGMAFLAVAREGLESVFFLLAVFQQSPTWSMPIRRGVGAVGGGCHRYADLSGRYAPELGEVFPLDGRVFDCGGGRSAGRFVSCAA
ncbi:Ferrous iron permease EfeU [Neisseria subflava]|nr:Ferrous iron permease EfeU [Neisseria subflava]